MFANTNHYDSLLDTQPMRQNKRKGFAIVAISLLVACAAVALFVSPSNTQNVELFNSSAPVEGVSFKAKADPCSYARIHGATWGMTDVTSHLSNEYNLGQRSWKATQDIWGKGLSEGSEVLTIVYSKCGNTGVVVAKTGETAELP